MSFNNLLIFRPFRSLVSISLFSPFPFLILAHFSLIFYLCCIFYTFLKKKRRIFVPLNFSLNPLLKTFLLPSILYIPSFLSQSCFSFLIPLSLSLFFISLKFYTWHFFTVPLVSPSNIPCSQTYSLSNINPKKKKENNILSPPLLRYNRLLFLKHFPYYFSPVYSHFPYCHFFPTISSPLLPSLSLSPSQPKNFHLEIPSSYTYRHRYAVESSKERKENRETRRAESVCPGLSVLSPTIPASKVFPSSSRDKKKRGRERKKGTGSGESREAGILRFERYFITAFVHRSSKSSSFCNAAAAVYWIRNRGCKLDGQVRRDPLVENWELGGISSFFFGNTWNCLKLWIMNRRWMDDGIEYDWIKSRLSHAASRLETFGNGCW